jgi:hypothetical protein
MKKLLFVAIVAAAIAFPSTAFAGAFTGIVVGKGGGNLAIAAKTGAVRTVHSSAHVRIGARVRVSGTSVRSFGFAHRARVHGVILRRVGRTTFLAAGRSLLAVRSGGRRLAAVGPSSGAVVNANVSVAGSTLTQQSMQVVGHDERVTIQAPVTAVGPGTITVSVNGQPLTIRLPAGIQLPASLVGQTVTLTIKVEDDNEIEIEDENEVENEENDDDGDRGGDHSGPGRGGDDDHGGDHSGPGGGGGDD